MGTLGRQSSVRRVLTYLSITAAAASSVLVLGTRLAAASSSEITVTDGTSFTAQEGATAADKVVANFTDTGPLITRPSTESIVTLTCSQLADLTYDTSISWGDGSSTAGTVSCTEGGFEVTGSHRYADSGTFQIDVTVTDNDDGQTATGTDTATATVTDATIQGIAPDNQTSVEGATSKIHVQFEDGRGGLVVDEGLTATIDWGDGTTSAGSVMACDCQGNIAVSGSHAYDATKPDSEGYTVTVTLTDDGGQSAVDSFTVTVADAELSGSGQAFTATAGASSSPVVASFTDKAGAQAAAADFTAAIKWGDGSTSAGTISKTDSGFEVSGTHTYASAGNQTLSITVTDEEGQIVRMAAAATVGAAPAVLPQTGQPRLPVTPSIPWSGITLVLLALAGGTAGLVTRRPQH